MRRPLRCYLLRPGFEPSQAFSDAITNVDRRGYVFDGATFTELDELEILQPNADMRQPLVVTISSAIATPWWLQSLSTELPESEEFLVGALPSRGAVVFCPVADPRDDSPRWIAWTFGIASRYLNRGSAEPRFGVIAALNRIIADGDEEALLRKLQYRQQGPYQQRVGHVASADTPLGGFRIDQVRDLLAAVGGTPRDDDAQVFGARNLLFRTEVEQLVETLVSETPGVMTEYRNDRYQAHFGFIDNYLPIEDHELVNQLDSLLLHELEERNDSVDVALPDDLFDFSDDRFLEYVLLPGEHFNQANRKVLTIGRVQNFMRDEGEDGLNASLRFADADQNPVDSVLLKDCLTADLRFENERYCLVDGTYFQVSEEFINRIDDEISTVPWWDGVLPSYWGGREDVWIADTAAETGYLVLDGTRIYLPGRSPFEPADLLTESGTLIHAKRKGRSRALSYLFAQASVSSQLLSEAPEAVEQLRMLVDENAAPNRRDVFLDALEALDRNRPDLEVVLAVLGYAPGSDVRSFPLIAKLELHASMRSIRQSGFAPRVALVPLGSQA